MYIASVHACYLEDYNQFNLTDKIQHELKAFEVMDTLKSILFSLESASQGKRLSLSLKQRSRNMRVRTDQSRFRQIFFLLLFTAVKESREDSKIKIELFFEPMQLNDSQERSFSLRREHKARSRLNSLNMLQMAQFDHLLVVCVRYLSAEDLPFRNESIDVSQIYEHTSDSNSTLAVEESNVCLLMICRQLCKYFRGDLVRGIGPDSERTYTASLMAADIDV